MHSRSECAACVGGGALQAEANALPGALCCRRRVKWEQADTHSGAVHQTWCVDATRGALCSGSALSASPAPDSWPCCSVAPAALLLLNVECPLCESLEEKLRSALEAASFGGGVLAQCTLETRVDLQSQETPFLRVIPGGTTQEVELPRPSPRVTPSKLAQQLDGWLHDACGVGDNAAAMPWDAVQGRAWPPQG